VDNHFIEPYYPTMEATHFKQIPHKGVEYDVSIIDTAGQDEYSLLSPKHAVGMHGYILVYSVASRQSFDMVKIVYEKLKNFQVRFPISNPVCVRRIEDTVAYVGFQCIGHPSFACGRCWSKSGFGRERVSPLP
jgi:Ras family